MKCFKHGAYLAVFETLDELMLIKYELHKMNTGILIFIIYLVNQKFTFKMRLPKMNEFDFLTINVKRYKMAHIQIIILKVRNGIHKTKMHELRNWLYINLP